MFIYEKTIYVLMHTLLITTPHIISVPMGYSRLEK